jgi:hypothetical protein
MKNGRRTTVALVFNTVESGTRAYRDQSPTCKRIERPYGSASSLKYGTCTGVPTSRNPYMAIGLATDLR